MILKEIEHLVSDPVHSLPTLCEASGRMVEALYGYQCIIKVYLIIEIVKTSVIEKRPVKPYIVDLSYKDYVRKC